MGNFNSNWNKNGSGCTDVTASKAIRKADRQHEKHYDTPYDPEAARFHKFLKAVWKMAEASGYHVENRIVVKDLETGKIWE